MNRSGLAIVAVSVALCAGCTSVQDEPSPSPTVMPIPADIQDFLNATVSGDVDAVRARLAIWNEAAGRNLKADEISLECAEEEMAAVAPRAANPELTAYVYTGMPVAMVRFEAPDGSNEGWGIEQRDDGWYWQPQSGSCLDLWNSPSPSPSA